MKYNINIKSNKDFFLTDDSELYEKSIVVDADNYYDATAIALKKASPEEIDDKFLPLTITISEIK